MDVQVGFSGRNSLSNHRKLSIGRSCPEILILRTHILVWIGLHGNSQPWNWINTCMHLVVITCTMVNPLISLWNRAKSYESIGGLLNIRFYIGNTFGCSINRTSEQMRVHDFGYSWTNMSAPNSRTEYDCSTFFKGDQYHWSRSILLDIYLSISKSEHSYLILSGNGESFTVKYWCLFRNTHGGAVLFVPEPL